MRSGHKKTDKVLGWIKEVMTIRHWNPSVPFLLCDVLIIYFPKDLKLWWMHRKDYSGPVYSRLVPWLESLLCAKTQMSTAVTGKGSAISTYNYFLSFWAAATASRGSLVPPPWFLAQVACGPSCSGCWCNKWHF